MKRIFLFTILLVSMLISCNIKKSQLLSGTTSILINLPADLKGANGYSVCVERLDRSQNTCTPGFLSENNVAVAGIDTKILNECPSGYKFKMWLWKTEGTSKKPLYAIDSASSNFTLQNGFLYIPQSELDDKLELDIHLGAVGSIPSFDTNCKIDSSNTSSNDPSKPDQPKEDTPTKPENNEPVPTGQIISVSQTPTIPKGYPTMVIYSASWCGACNTLKSEIRSSQGAKFKGKMHIYDANTDAGARSPYGSTSAIPTIDFYDKEAKHQGQIVGGDWNKINSYFNRLTN